MITREQRVGTGTAEAQLRETKRFIMSAGGQLHDEATNLRMPARTYTEELDAEYSD
jgi:hypothetical protein